MFSFLQKLFGSNKKRYGQQKELLSIGDEKSRRALATDSATSPEILYYLAKDAKADIRCAVATNKTTPLQASALLAMDQDVDVRMALAARLVELLPHLSEEKHSQLYSYAVQALGALAQDEVLKIRSALSSALKDHAKTPPKIAGQLARDVEREVSEPILRFCLNLADEDMLDILGGHPQSWVISAIAARPVVSETVATAVADIGDAPASGILVKNKGAKFSPATLEKIIEQSRDYPDWHEALAVRSEISIEMAQKLAGFVNASILNVLEKRADFDSATRKEIVDIVKRRLEYQTQGAPYESPESKVTRFAKSGKLTAGVVTDALAWQDHKFVLLALAQLSNIHPVIVEKMLQSGSAKPVVALCWKAKLPMRVAVELQRSYSRLQPKEFLYAKGGTDYPLSPAEIKWQLDFFGVSV
jgi:uncharacterized protein (DUF2336 family)